MITSSSCDFREKRLPRAEELRRASEARVSEDDSEADDDLHTARAAPAPRGSRGGLDRKESRKEVEKVSFNL
eukprot:818448-Amorphochlora_amoeboformis.AAC.1